LAVGTAICTIAGAEMRMASKAPKPTPKATASSSEYLLSLVLEKKKVSYAALDEARPQPYVSPKER